MSDPSVFSTLTLPSGGTYEFKDNVARRLIQELTNAMSGAVHYVGTTTTVLSDGATTKPVMVEGASYTQKAGDVVDYGSMEYIWNEVSGVWREFGSTGSLKALAFKDSATGSFTPAGTVNVTPSVTMSKTSVKPIASVGTLPELVFTVTGENLAISWSAGALPTAGADVSVATDVASATATASFTGTPGTVTVS